MTTLIGLDSVAVGTTDLTQSDLDLGLGDAFGCADVPVLDAPDVIEIERDRARAVSAVHASSAKFEVVEPSPRRGRSIVGSAVHVLAVSGGTEPRLAPLLRLHCVVLTSATGSIATAVRAVQRAISLRLKGLSADGASAICFRRVLPGRHDHMLAATDVRYPCKPDIFAKTYDAVTPTHDGTDGREGVV